MKPAKLARTLVRDVKFFCDYILLELWCISVTDVLLESSFSMFWFNASNSGRIFLSELAYALWLQIVLLSAVILLLPIESQPFAKRNTFSPVNTTVKKEKKSVDHIEPSFLKCIKT